MHLGARGTILLILWLWGRFAGGAFVVLRTITWSFELPPDALIVTYMYVGRKWNASFHAM